MHDMSHSSLGIPKFINFENSIENCKYSKWITYIVQAGIIRFAALLLLGMMCALLKNLGFFGVNSTIGGVHQDILSVLTFLSQNQLCF